MSYRQTIDCASCGLLRLCLAGRVSTAPMTAQRLQIRRAQVRAGDCLFRAGEPVHSLFTLRSGCVKEVTTVSGAVLGFAVPGEILGLEHAESASFAHTAMAVADSHYCEVSWRSLRQLWSESPEVGSEVIALMARVARTSQQMLGVMRDQQSLQRVSVFLLNLSLRLGKAGALVTDFRFGMGRADIASYLGLSSETVSRCFSELVRLNLISVQAKRIQLLNVPSLRSLFAADDELPAIT